MHFGADTVRQSSEKEMEQGNSDYRTRLGQVFLVSSVQCPARSKLKGSPASWAGLGWAGLGWGGAGLGWAGLGWAGLGWAGLGWAGLGWAGLGWAGLGCAGLGRAGLGGLGCGLGLGWAGSGGGWAGLSGAPPPEDLVAGQGASSVSHGATHRARRGAMLVGGTFS